ncbi:hypothetical protein [Oligoflexus tunisiensis]|uniref:hypothetical protein n=1 Tax=Oligoflexus tunisiensis TaxID=708132 RepID=UPI00114CDD5F|nr:hypothetical protein [Oligoflexus tunisiensis]
MGQRFRIWYAFLGGALAWTLHLMGTYGISEGYCRGGFLGTSFLGLSLMHWGVGLLTLFATAITLGALYVARRHHLASLASLSTAEGDINLFMARSSLLSNGLFLIIIVAQSFPIFILGRNC